MTNQIVRQQISQNPDPQSKPLSGDDITPSQEQILPDRLPKSLVEWLAQINQRYQAVHPSQPNDTS